MASKPIALKLGILLLATRLEKDRVAALRDGCDWEGVHDLPFLSFEEMAAILRSAHPKFAPILERAREEGADEAKLLRAFYGLSEGTFQRFENILNRLTPLLQAEGDPAMPALHAVLEEYARINSRGSPQREKPAKATPI